MFVEVRESASGIWETGFPETEMNNGETLVRAGMN